MFSMSVSLRQGLFWSFFKRSPLPQGIFIQCAKPDSSVSLLMLLNVRYFVQFTSFIEMKSLFSLSSP